MIKLDFHGDWFREYILPFFFIVGGLLTLGLLWNGQVERANNVLLWLIVMLEIDSFRMRHNIRLTKNQFKL